MSARYEPALLPPCLSIRALCYSNCQRSTQSHQQSYFCGDPGALGVAFLYQSPTTFINAYCQADTNQVDQDRVIQYRGNDFSLTKEVCALRVLHPVELEYCVLSSSLWCELP